VIEEIDSHSEAIAAGLMITPNYKVYEWSRNGYKVFFSATRQGNAMPIHIAAPKESRRCLRIASNEFCEHLFSEYEWCEVVIAAVIPISVVNLAHKCGFHHIGDALIGEDSKEGKIMARFRQ
jgi:hypothetical protein